MLLAAIRLLCGGLPAVVDFPDVVGVGEFGGLVGLLGDRALEVGIGDVLREPACDPFGFGAVSESPARWTRDSRRWPSMIRI